MLKTNHRAFTMVSLLSVIAIAFALLVPLVPLNAGSLTTVHDYLFRNDPSLASGEKHEVFFTTAGTVTGGAGVNKIILVFPDGDDSTWCKTVGTGDLVITGITDPTGGTGHESATSLPGTLTGACTQGSGASSYDTITISGVNDLAAATKYGVRIGELTSTKLGTPLASSTGSITVKTNNGSGDVDTEITAVDIVANDEIAVTAAVPPSITFTISDSAITLGTLSSSSVSYDSLTIRTETNAGSGYTSFVYSDGTLNNGANTIDAVSDGAVSVGAEEYGIATSDAGQDISQDTDCATAAYTSSGLTTTQQSVASGTTGPVDETSTICYAASIAGTTVAGNYDQVVYFVTVGLF